MNKSLLIFTDGYSISTNKFESHEAAVAAMNEDYERRNLNDSGDEWDDMSYNDGECSATLYDRGENVFVWSIEDL